METAAVWLFTIHCLTSCGSERSPMTNKYMSASSYSGCVTKAKRLLELVGAQGQWEIECRPYQRTITTKEKPSS